MSARLDVDGGSGGYSVGRRGRTARANGRWTGWIAKLWADRWAHRRLRAWRLFDGVFRFMAASAFGESEEVPAGKATAEAWVILGPTGCGKSAVAHLLAVRTGAEIVSADSMKVYRGMDIGTAKPSPKERAEARYHLLDAMDPWEKHDVKAFVSAALAAMADASARGKSVLIEGGTALYLKALMEGIFDGPGERADLRRVLEDRARTEGPAALHAELAAVDPVAAARISPGDARRIVRALEVYAATGRPISSLQGQFGMPREGWRFKKVGLARRREDLYARINRRVDDMLAAGWAEECRMLAAKERPLSVSAAQALGYAHIFAAIRGEISFERAAELIKRDTRHFARKQITWYRKFKEVAWLAVEADEAPEATAERALAAYEGRIQDAGRIVHGPEIV